jgi:quercetin dioxygenase-like cupin family protein
MDRETLQFEWGEMTKMVDAQTGDSEELAVSHMVVRPGKSSPVHYHPNCEEAIYLIRGTLEHKIDDKVYPQAAGSTVVVPRGAPHITTNVGNEDAEVVVAYSEASPEHKPGTP